MYKVFREDDGTYRAETADKQGFPETYASLGEICVAIWDVDAEATIILPSSLVLRGKTGVNLAYVNRNSPTPTAPLKATNSTQRLQVTIM